MLKLLKTISSFVLFNFIYIILGKPLNLLFNHVGIKAQQNIRLAEKYITQR